MTKQVKQTANEIAKWAEGEDAKRVDQAQYGTLSDKDKVTQIYKAIPIEVGNENERRILAVKLLPEHLNWTITKICDVAGINRRAWYRAHQRHNFGEICRQFIKNIKGHFLPAVFSAFIQNSLGGNATTQIKYLQNEGILREDETPINIGIPITIGGDRDDRQRKSSASVLGRLRNPRFVVSDN